MELTPQKRKTLIQCAKWLIALSLVLPILYTLAVNLIPLYCNIEYIFRDYNEFMRVFTPHYWMLSNLIRILAFVVMLIAAKNIYIQIASAFIALSALCTLIISYCHMPFSLANYINIVCLIALFIGIASLCCSKLIRKEYFRILMITACLLIVNSIATGYYLPGKYFNSPIIKIYSVLTLLIFISYTVASIVLWLKVSNIANISEEEENTVKNQIKSVLTSRFAIGFPCIYLCAIAVYFIICSFI